MGSAFELTITGMPEERAAHFLSEGTREIERIEALLSEFRDDSITGLVNRNAGIRSVVVPEEVYNLIKRCQHISSLTQGAFDITVKPLKRLYDFRKKELKLPDRRLIEKTLGIIGYQNIQLGKGNRVYLSKRGMEISFAGIGKGYAADRVRMLWSAGGVKNGVINASGDLSVLGERQAGTPWKVAVADPLNPSNPILHIPLREGSVATSGDYEQYFVHTGTRYSHTLDPASGYPVTGVKSVTVAGPGAELCDALATAVTVMGVEAGIYLINQLPDTHCLVIDDRNAIHYSKNITFEKVN